MDLLRLTDLPGRPCLAEKLLGKLRALFPVFSFWTTFFLRTKDSHFPFMVGVNLLK